ncbi:MAG: hypothetical protein HOK49_13295 [Opitutae bacterium]|nr:hypothetical protein [Opitutae bacterium]
MRSRILFCLAGFCLNQFQTGVLSAQTLSGASAHFTFNESSGEPRNIANGSFAKILGGATQGVRGVIAKGIYLDGADGYVNLGRSASIKPTGAFTFTTHFYLHQSPLGNSNYYRIIDATGEGGPPTSGYRLQIYHDAVASKVRAMVIVMNKGTRFDTMIDLDDPVGWHFVVFTFDPEKDELRLNIDGHESARDLPADFNAVSYLDTDVILGGTGTSHFFPGILDDSRIYPKALTIEELDQLRIPLPVVGITREYVAGVTPDGDGDNQWEDLLGATDFPFTFATGQETHPIEDVTFPRIESAYEFPAAKATAPSGSKLGSSHSASFEIWFKPEDLNDNHILFEIGGEGSGSTLAMQADQLHWITQTGNNSNRMKASVTLPAESVGIWNQAVVVNHIKGDGRGEIFLFLNGGIVEDTDSRDTGYTNWAGGNGSGLGRFSGNYTGNDDVPTASIKDFNGQISIWRFYSGKVLTKSDASQSFRYLQTPLLVLPEIETFASDKTNVPLGEKASLLWSTEGAEVLEVSPHPGNVNFVTTAGEGTAEIIPSHSGIYSLHAANEYGESSARVEILVDDKRLEPRITEFLAINDGPLLDGDGRKSDWIELYNPSLSDTVLTGWSLTDDITNITKWKFPDGTIIAPDEYSIVFATTRLPDAANPDAAGYLHTNFKLDGDKGFLALVRPDGSIAQQFVSELNNEYPKQFKSVSWGLSESGTISYHPIPTPSAPNGIQVIGFVKDTKFSTPRGFYDQPITVEITSSTEGADIWYTLDGSPPSIGMGSIYSSPFDISKTTILRAAAFKLGFAPSNIDTQTYVFVDDVVKQPANPVGFPTEWAGKVADYEMDPEVIGETDIFNGTYRQSIKDDLKSLPVMSVVMAPEDLFGNAGIYDHPQADGFAWEKPASIELFFNDSQNKDLQVDCGIRIYGGSSRSPNFPKHGFRLCFRKKYGAGKLKFPLFADQPFGVDATDEFDELILRGGFNNSWAHWHWHQNPRAQYIRDQFVRDSQLAMGWPSPHGMFVHLYLNGLYWGLYNPSERPTESFMASYYDGEPEQFDTQNVNEAKSGDLQTWNTMMALANGGLGAAEAYGEIQEYLDVDNLIDYMMLNFYVGNDDWDGHNWYAGRKREVGAGYQFFSWDAELSISRHANPPPQPDFDIILNRDRTGLNSNNKPSRLYTKLRDNLEFRVRFGDQVHKHFFNGGVLSTEKVLQRWIARRDQVWPAIVAESARWGDYRRDVLQGGGNTPDQYDLFHRDKHYVDHQSWLLQTYFPQRGTIVLDQFRTRQLYPNVAAPEFSQYGGSVETGFILSISNPGGQGQLYFTEDGSDPRAVGGAINATASVYAAPLAITQSGWRKSRVLHNGEWSALNEAWFGLKLDLRITEINFHPAENPDHEFIEITNAGTEVADLSGVMFTDGIQYAFANDTILGGGKSLILVVNETAFNARYPGIPVAGTYLGRLRNEGERIALATPTAELFTVIYNNKKPWPAATEGKGFTLVLKDLTVDSDPADPSNWRTSTKPGGSPGEIDPDPMQDTDADSLPDSWEFLHFNNLEQTAESDPDHDGYVNLIELALGSNPEKATSINHPAVGLHEGTHLSLTYRRPINLRDWDYRIEVSSDLNIWNNGHGHIELISTTMDGDEEIIVSRDVTSITASSGKRFIRLVIESP